MSNSNEPSTIIGLNYDPNNVARKSHTVSNEVGAIPELNGALTQPLVNDWTKMPGRWGGPNCASKRPTK